MHLLSSRPDLLLAFKTGDGIPIKFVTPVKGRNTEEKSGSQGAYKSSRTKTPTSTLSAPQQQGNLSTPAIMAPISDLSSTVAYMHATPHENMDEVDVDSLRQAAVQLRAVVFIVSPHPTLRRVLLSHGARFVESLADAVRYSHLCRNLIKQQMIEETNSSRHECTDRNVANELFEVVLAVDEAVLGTLETLAQVDITEGLLTVRQYQQFQMLHVPQHSEILSFVVPSVHHKCAFLDRTLCVLLPVAAELVSHHDGDTRVIAASTLRKLVPLLLRTLFTLSSDAALYGIDLETVESQSNQSSAADCRYLKTCLSSPANVYLPIFPKISSMLADQSPVPQFAVRMLVDSFSVCSNRARGEIIAGLRQHGCISVLINMLKAATPPLNSSNDGGNDDGAQYEQDPQLVTLLRMLFEGSQASQQQVNPASPVHDSSAAIAVSMLDGDLIGAVVNAVKFYVPIGGVVAFDVLLPLLELLYVILNFIIRCEITSEEQKHSSGQLRKYAHPLRSLCSWLFGTLLARERQVNYVKLREWIDDETTPESNDDNNSSYFAHDTDAGQDEEVVRNMSSLRDLATRCISFLFDIFPDVVISHLLQSKPPGSEAPKRIVAFLLLQADFSLRSRIRILKLLWASQRVSCCDAYLQNLITIIGCPGWRCRTDPGSDSEWQRCGATSIVADR
jgi:hypothetical protein